MIYVIGYILIGLIVGKLSSNYYLNREYSKQVERINVYYKSKYSKETDEEYIARMKADAYEVALESSNVDRRYSFGIGAIAWPAAIVVLLVAYSCSLLSRIKLPAVGMSKASRDFLKAQKQVKIAQEQRAIEADQNAVWNAMVDVLNENNLNHMNYQKK